MYIISQILGAIGAISNIVSMQIKDKKHILFVFIIAGLAFSASYVLLGAYSGALICFIATVQTVINYILEVKQKKFPNWLGFIYIIIAIICGFVGFKSIIDILPVIAGVTYVLSILQEKEKHIRIISLTNAIMWLIYDLIVGAYATVISDVFFSASAIIGIIRFDILKKRS